MFDFEKAQVYELKYNIIWAESAYKQVVAAMKNGAPYQHCNEFFNDSKEEMDEFFETVKDKACLEVSPGICGAFPFWKDRLNGELIALDPLLSEYDKFLKTKGKSWFDGIGLITEKAENFLPELEGKIDGMIFWRNGINHYEEPFTSIETVSKYAAKGCRMFFWSEIKHASPPDAGHRDITDNPKEIEYCILAQGWRMLYRTKPGVFNQLGVEFGGVFEKI